MKYTVNHIELLEAVCDFAPVANEAVRCKTLHEALDWTDREVRNTMRKLVEYGHVYARWPGAFYATVAGHAFLRNNPDYVPGDTFVGKKPRKKRKIGKPVVKRPKSKRKT